jgi:hypothetical protein
VHLVYGLGMDREELLQLLREDDEVREAIGKLSLESLHSEDIAELAVARIREGLRHGDQRRLPPG